MRCFKVLTTLALGLFAVPLYSQPAPRVVHAFVALADNHFQGIVPVPAAIGNGDDPARNLYWGAAFGVRTFFRRSPDWKEVAVIGNPDEVILERAVFLHRASNTYLVADAYRGREIKKALFAFFNAAAGESLPAIGIPGQGPSQRLYLSGKTDLVVFVGHDGLMDFSIALDFKPANSDRRQAIVLACASKAYFSPALRSTGAEPLLWTTNLMAPEAYTLKAALDGWLAAESPEEIRNRAAAAYAKYQKISQAAALRLFSSSW